MQGKSRFCYVFLHFFEKFRPKHLEKTYVTYCDPLATFLHTTANLPTPKMWLHFSNALRTFLHPPPITR